MSATRTPAIIQVAADQEALARTAAEWVTSQMEAVLQKQPMFRLSLAGGSTPRATYRLLGNPAEPWRQRIAWERLEFFWGDERLVAATHADSNYRMANEALLSRVPVQPAHVHRVMTELATPDAVAAAYEAELRAVFAVASLSPSSSSLQSPLLWPAFDLVLLGLGADGHIASLFPGTTAVDETQRWVVAPFVEKFGTHRISLTLPVINNASAVAFLVSGSDKAETVARVLSPSGARDLPAARVQPQGELVWLLDCAAAGGLEP